MGLQKRLDEIKAGFEGGLPPEIKETMHRTTAELAASGIMDKVLKAGAPMPDFTLLDERENEIDSRSLLTKGPLVVSFYRGAW